MLKRKQKKGGERERVKMLSPAANETKGCAIAHLAAINRYVVSFS